MARTRVDYWEKWAGTEWDAMADIVHSFNEAQDTYRIVMRHAGDWSSSPDLPSFLSAQRRGAPPDLIGLEDHQIVDLAAQGALSSLKEDVTPLQLSQLGYHERFCELSAYEGELYGVPISVDIVTLYVNLASVKRTRFEGGLIPADLSEFEVGLDELRVQGKIGFVPTYPGWWPQAWAWLFGGFWLDSHGRFTPDHPRNVEAYDWISSFRNRWNLEAFAEPINPIGAQEPDPFLTGEVAMVFEGDWLVRRLIQVPGLQWVPAGFPTVDRGPAALIVADVLCIPSGARHPEGAAEFIRFLIQSERVEQLALGQEKISPLRRWSERFSAQHRNPKLGMLKEILSSARLFHDPRVPRWTNYLCRIKQAFTNMWSGRQNPAQALVAIREELSGF